MAIFSHKWQIIWRKAEAPPDSDYLSLLRYLSFLVLMADFWQISESFAESVNLIRKRLPDVLFSPMVK